MHSPIKTNVLQHKINTTTKARFSCLLQHPAWKRWGPILLLALHKFVTYLLTYIPTVTQPRAHTGHQQYWRYSQHYKHNSETTTYQQINKHRSWRGYRRETDTAFMRTFIKICLLFGSNTSSLTQAYRASLTRCIHDVCSLLSACIISVTQIFANLYSNI